MLRITAPLNRKRQLITSRNVKDHNVGIKDTSSGEGFTSAGDEGGNNGRVPSCMDDGDAKLRACYDESLAET